jgi:hypothetical protein
MAGDDSNLGPSAPCIETLGSASVSNLEEEKRAPVGDGSRLREGKEAIADPLTTVRSQDEKLLDLSAVPSVRQWRKAHLYAADQGAVVGNRHREPEPLRRKVGDHGLPIRLGLGWAEGVLKAQRRTGGDGIDQKRSELINNLFCTHGIKMGDRRGHDTSMLPSRAGDADVRSGRLGSCSTCSHVSQIRPYGLCRPKHGHSVQWWIGSPSLPRGQPSAAVVHANPRSDRRGGRAGATGFPSPSPKWRRVAD